MSEFIDQLIKIIGGLISLAIPAGIGYWFIKPITRYHEIRRRILEDFVFYAQVINPQGLLERLTKLYERRVESNRRNAAELSACLLELPKWYLGWLHRRGHTPESVPSNLIGFSNTHDEDVARKRMNKIKKCFGLTIPDDDL